MKMLPVNFIAILMLWLLAFLTVGNSIADESRRSVERQAATVDTRSAKNTKSVLRKKNIEPLNTLIKAHFYDTNARNLIRWLSPKEWKIDFDVPAEKLNRQLNFHAETTRRHALNELLDGLGLQGIFYPGERLIVIAWPVK